MIRQNQPRQEQPPKKPNSLKSGQDTVMHQVHGKGTSGNTNKSVILSLRRKASRSYIYRKSMIGKVKTNFDKSFILLALLGSAQPL